MLFTAVLCLSGSGLAAEPTELQKNQILVVASCEDDTQEYTFVINGMSKTGQVTPRTDATVSNVSNVVVKQFTVDYYNEHGTPEDTQDDVLVGSDVYGNKKYYDEDGNPVLNGDLIHCSGTTRTELQGLGPVRAVYDFQAFVTPRGKA
jgi:hypothetical protein